jgi:hypothetical protein
MLGIVRSRRMEDLVTRGMECPSATRTCSLLGHALTSCDHVLMNVCRWLGGGVLLSKPACKTTSGRMTEQFHRRSRNTSYRGSVSLVSVFECRREINDGWRTECKSGSCLVKLRFDPNRVLRRIHQRERIVHVAWLRACHKYDMDPGRNRHNWASPRDQHHQKDSVVGLCST